MQTPPVSAKGRLSTTPEERAEYVRLFEKVGKSAAEFCREFGLAETTLAVWRRQVRGPAGGKPLAFPEVPTPLVEAALAAPPPMGLKDHEEGLLPSQTDPAARSYTEDMFSGQSQFKQELFAQLPQNDTSRTRSFLQAR